MTTKADDVNKIMEYLIRGEEAPSYLTDEATWPGADELLDMFSLEDPSLSLLETPLPDLSLADLQYPAVPPSSCSDSGLSSDPADLTDYDQQLSPFLIQNSCSGNSSPQLSPRADNLPSPAYEDVLTCGDDAVQICQEDVEICQDVICEDVPMCHDSPGSPQGVVEVETTKPLQIHSSKIVFKDTFQNQQNRKRRSSITPKMAVVQPKLQKTITTAPVTVTSKPHVIGQQQKAVKVANIQVINPQPRVFCKPNDNVGQRKVIRVAPMAGNPRSILLPVTIKDMKDLRGIKIINASDFKSGSNIKLAAANLMAHTKVQEIKTERNVNVEYDSNHEDSSEGSDEEEWPSRSPQHPNPNIPNKKNQYPRLVLSPEERKLLAKEGIKLPASYPLTKHEERELKRIRRKIRNKISAQDSRKRKKEYVDGLEDRVKQCSEENQTLMKRIKLLQSQNQSLSAQLKRLQALLSGGGGKSAQPATCLLVLLMSVALVALPSLREERAATREAAAPAAHHTPHHALHRALLSATHKATSEEIVLDDGEFNMEELITFKTHSDHDYQVRKLLPPPTAVPHGYRDIPIDEDWPPSLKSKIKFDYDDGPDYLPLIKDENYQNFKNLKMDALNVDTGGRPFVLMEGGKLNDLGMIAVKNEDIITEQVNDSFEKNSTMIRSVVVNGTRANM